MNDLSGFQNFTGWDSAVTVFWENANVVVLEDVAWWASEFILDTEVDAALLLTLWLAQSPRVTDLIALDNALLWLGASGSNGLDFWGGAWSGVAAHVNALDILVDAVTSGTGV